MTREAFIRRRFSADSYARIAQANDIIAAYAAQGYTLTLRQLYYQHVARDLIPNTERSYQNLGRLISEARLAGHIDWEAIEDRGRVSQRAATWDHPGQIIDAAARQFQIDKWEEQTVYLEVMVEKQALENILIPACRQADIRFTANKGYSSSSAVYEAAARMQEAQEAGKVVHLLYCGDHDPSGIDMSRDIATRLRTFLRIANEDEYEGDEEEWDEYMDRWDVYGEAFELHRLALNIDQVQRYRPPENPAKLSDARAAGYVARFGPSSWELDALEPSVLAGLVTTTVARLRDNAAWARALGRERDMKDRLAKYAAEWEGAA